jgi:Ala-tRNA(Pro) deacylase
MERDVHAAISQYFADNHIPYREIHHAPGGSTEDYHQAVGCRYEQQAKCLFLKVRESDRSYFVICAIPAQKKANMKALRDLLSAKEVGFATKDELKTVTGCNFGELAPVGKLFGVPLLMESDFLNETEIFINAGRLDISFAFNPHDLARVESPIFFQVSP